MVREARPVKGIDASSTPAGYPAPFAGSEANRFNPSTSDRSRVSS
jgi:hypothetical protein